MKGTRLWQETGSPLISGRSRREQPLTFDWAAALLIGWLAGCAWILLTSEMAPLVAAIGEMPVFLLAMLGAASGAYLGVALARQMGWRRRWVAGSIAAGVLSLVAVLLLRSVAVSVWTAILKG